MVWLGDLAVEWRKDAEAEEFFNGANGVVNGAAAACGKWVRFEALDSRLAANEVKMVAGAFASLARMDSGFEKSAERVVDGACAEFSNEGSGCAAGARG